MTASIAPKEIPVDRVQQPLRKQQGDYELQAADAPDLGAQQVPEAQLESDREQQQQHAEMRDVVEQRSALDAEGIEQKACSQKTHQRR